jgi:aryl-alcohol dehydrogenase-like predicted oxidoreductase
MDELARQKNASVSQIALAWLLTDPLITSSIIGANSMEQLKDNLGAVEICLTTAEKDALDKATTWKDENKEEG